MKDFKLHYVCPRCGHKLSKVDAMEHATLAIRRKCGKCGRKYALTITPIAIAAGWAHSACITELEQKITVIE